MGPSGVSGKTGAEARLALYFHRSLTTTTSAAAQELQQHSSHTSAPSPPTGRPVTGRATPYGLGGPDMTKISMVSVPGKRVAGILNADGAVRNTARMSELQHCCHPQKPALGAEWQWVAMPCRCCRCRARSTEGARPRCSERRSPSCRSGRCTCNTMVYTTTGTKLEQIAWPERCGYSSATRGGSGFVRSFVLLLLLGFINHAGSRGRSSLGVVHKSSAQDLLTQCP